MSALGRRLLYYFTGFGIGLIFVLFFFQNRGCSWTPDNRVKQSITDRVIVFSEDFQTEMTKRGITPKMVEEVLLKGDIDFKNSKKEGNPKVYRLFNDKLKIDFTLPENSYISEVGIGYQTNQHPANSKKGISKLTFFPKEEKLIFVDSLTEMSENFIALGNPTNEQILSALKKSGEIDFQKSNYAALPKAEHYLICEINQQKVGFKTFWYKNRINIFHIDRLDLTNQN